MDMPLVTIMIPTYNQQDFIARSIKSALAQDYPNLEVVVADDCSTDKTGEIAQSFSLDNRLRYMRNEKNLGKRKNYRHTLYKKAKGDWVLNLDADDYLTDASYIGKAMNIIINNPEVAVVFARLNFHYKDTNQLIPSFFSNKTKTINDGNYFFFNLLNPEAINHTTAVYNRRLAKEIDFYRSESISCDWESLARLCLHGKVAFLNQFVAIWEIHGQNESMNMNSKGFTLNLESFHGVYLYAKEKKAAKQTKLLWWKFKIIYAYSFLIIGRLFLDRKLKTVGSFLRKLIKFSPFIGSLLLLDLRLYVMMMIGNTKVEKLLRKIFYRIKGGKV